MNKIISLSDNISIIPGIGIKKAACLNRMGIFDIRDILYHLPYKYKNKKNIYNISQAPENIDVLVKAVLRRKQQRSIGRGRSIVECGFVDGNDTFSVVFFNMPYMKNTLNIGVEYSIFGKVSRKNGKPVITNPEIYVTGSEKDVRCYVPVYRCTQGVTNHDFNKWVKYILNNIIISEWIDASLIEKNNLCSRFDALKYIHFPNSNTEYKYGKARLIYDELLIYQIAVRRKRKILDEIPSYPLEVNDENIFIQSLPFKLTEGQISCIGDIKQDMSQRRPMNRLIQGDVGCGKTVVAETAIYIAAIAGTQAAMMAPTEILARQHYNRLVSDFAQFGINVGLLTSGMSSVKRRELLVDLKNGRIHVLVGTHALIQDDVEFNKLTLVVTDEQHRFGVNQRRSLVRKGESVNVLVMSATPIPRTLAATVYGDMDFSIIRNKPADRKGIITRSLTQSSREIAYKFLLEELSKGNKAYLVAPTIDNEDNNLESVNTLFEEVARKFASSNPKIIHGKLSKEDKENIMNDFAYGDTNLLVATVVIEVGIDVPNASIIIIENSERFGLAQLHQLRGRVGRSDIQSYCFLINYSNSDDAIERNRIMTEISDGFEISEEDYKLRGPGDILGTMQHGSFNSHIIALCSHKELLDIATKDAEHIIESDYNCIDINEVNDVIAKYDNNDNSNII